MDNSAKTDEQVFHHVLWELTHAYRTQGLAHSCLYLAYQTALVSILSPGSSPELTVPLRAWQEHHLSLVPAHHFGGYSCPHSHGPGQQISSEETYLQVQLHQFIFLHEVVESPSSKPGLSSLVSLPQVNEDTQALLDAGEGPPEGPGDEHGPIRYEGSKRPRVIQHRRTLKL